MTVTWGAIIDAAGGTGAVAAALVQSDSTVSGWRSRGIPGPHWAGLVRLATEQGRHDVTLEILAGIAARKLEPATEPTEARA